MRIFHILALLFLAFISLKGQEIVREHNYEAESAGDSASVYHSQSEIEPSGIVLSRLEQDYELRMELLEAKLKAARMRTWAMVLLLVLYAVAAIFVYRNHQLRTARILAEEQAENERLMNVAEDLQERMAEMSAKASEEDKQKVEKPFGGAKLDILQRLCEQYYIYEGTENLQPKILKEVKSMIDGLRGDSKELEEELDNSSGGVMTKFRTEFPKMKEEDVKLFCFVASGFSSTTISAIMEKEKQYIYNRIYRLKNRITESEAPNKAMFLEYMKK